MAYDLVSSQYGWSDQQIGDLPLGRFRQITTSIQLRKFHAQREENSRTSWLGRIMAQYIAAGFQIPEGKENVALQNAGVLAIDDIERAVLEEQAQMVSEAPKVNTKGSFERLMGFGGHMQAQGQ